MKKLRISVTALVLMVIFLGTPAMIGCREPHPDILLGTWQEADCSRGIVFKQNGDFQFVDFDQHLHAVVNGMGTWEVDLT